MSLRAALPALVLAAPLFVAVTLRLGPDPVALADHAPLIARGNDWAGARACQTCHPDHHASWQRTHHATMTQRPTPDAVLGRFDGQPVRYAGLEARPFRDGSHFCMDLPMRGGGRRTAEVALAVGSRRYQQYFEQEQRGDTTAFVRLPLLWHVASQRWLHVNTVFLDPDDDDWDAHRSTWNENCIYCHNTAPQPRVVNFREPSRLQDGNRFDSRVDELGIACESCHGPGRAHATARTDPLSRYRLHLSGAADPTIVLPSRLGQERANGVCGQCHGQRLPEPIARMADWLTTGPTFRAGDRLADHVAPIAIDTPVRGKVDPDNFRLRFWADGTPRLTAYELQGITASRCSQRSAMTCLSCHAMHEGDPKGQLRPDLPGDSLCTQCHAAIARDVPAHTHHAAASPGSRCVECHMPRIVYGILDVHRSHRIDSPDAARDAAAGRPHACTLCHADRTPGWAAQRLRAWYGDHFAEPARRRDGAGLDLPDAIASLHAGDAAQRAVWAAALGRPAVAIDAGSQAALRAHLAVAMGDGYPSIRWLAQRSLQQVEQRGPVGLGPALQQADSMAGADERQRTVFALLDLLALRAPGRLPAPAAGLLLGGDFRLDLRAVMALTDLQGRHVIAIGE